MLSQLGYYSLIFGLVFSIFIIFQSIKPVINKSNLVYNNIFFSIFLQFFFVILSFALLTSSFIISDFSNLTVFNNSHTEKPLFYKISGVWGNHEGSLLLWLLVLTLFVLIFVVKSKELDNRYRLLTIFFQEIIIVGFFLFVILTSNPFTYIYPSPIEGLGLNPILQDPALAIHPPILYVGYVGTSLIFSSSLAATINKNINSEWAKHIKKWVLASWIFLTLGIMLGSIWAYYELGWGGFWFWDPVENVSLMPWFCLTALIHTLLVLEKRNQLKNWSVILAISTFSLSMSGTFLVRSGILNSIHTFANDPSRGLFILTFLFILIISAIFIFFFYSKDNTKNINNFNWLSKDTLIVINNWFMMYFLSVVLIGTVYPIFLEVLANEKISVGPPFYQKLIIPFLIPFLLAMILSTRIKWIKDNFDKVNLKQLLIFILMVIFSVYILNISEKKYLFASILISASFFLFINSLGDFFKKNIKYSQKISHFAFSTLILSILLNGIFSTEINTNMKEGDQISFKEKIIKFKTISFEKENNYKLMRGNFELFEPGKITINFSPEIRVYDQPKISTSEADIKTNLFNDNFIVFSLLSDDGMFNVRYQHKPFMIWIWISSLVLAVGGVFATVRK